MLDERLKRVAVFGAAGKMGRGISLLLLEEISRLEASLTGDVGKGEYCLTLIDPTEEAFAGLKSYLREQITRYAEKNMNSLRTWFAKNPKLISNEEMIDAFVQGALDTVYYAKEPEAALSSHLIFEAIVENPVAKRELFSRLKTADHSHAFFFTNTSSIPIGAMSRESGIDGRLIGFHFYNPPPVQKLLEIIPAEDTLQELIALAEELAKRLSKKAIFSRDVAGFIGNGLFLREIDLALQEAKELTREKDEVEAIFLVNQMTEELLLRPMGIFQLLDYVGIDVIQKVKKIMEEHLKLSFHFEWIDQMVAFGRVGGQYPDGSQKPGFFEYEENKIKKIFSIQKKAYVPLPQDLIGTRPEGGLTWKGVIKKKEKDQAIQAHMESLFQMTTQQAQLAQRHLRALRTYAQALVKEGVAHRIEDVNAVMMNGFYHLYGPEPTWLAFQEVLK